MANLSNINNKFLVTTGGDVGINSTAPTTKLHVVGVIKAENTASGAELLQLKYGSSGDAIFVKKLSSTNGIEFNGFNGTSWTNNILVIEDTGNVGINTTSPAQKLEIAGGYLKFSGGDYGIQGSASLTYNPVSDHYFQASGSTKVTFKADGKVGIGSTSPQTKFVVQHTDGGTGIEFSMGASLSYIQCYNRTSSDYIALKIDAEDLRFGTNDGSERMRIASGGNVGISEDAPSTLLSLKGGADTSIITLKCTKNDSSWSGERIGGINFFSEDGSGPGAGIRGSINYVAASSSGGDTAMNFATGDNSTKMTIDNDGKVGIGYTSPGSQLSIYKTAFGGDTAGSGGTLDFGVGSTKYWQFRLDTSSSGDLAIDKTYANTWTTPVTIERSSGNTTFTGNVTIDNTTSGNAQLTLVTTTGGDPTIVMNSDAANRSGVIKYQDAGTNAGRIQYEHSADRIDIQAGSATGATMSIKNGTVGIGTTAPTTALSVSDGASMYANSNYLVQIKRDATNSDDDTSKASILLANNSNAMQIAYGGTTDRLRFIDGGGVERFTMLNGGNIGLSTTNPDAYNSNGRDLVIVRTGNCGMSIISGSSSNGSLLFGDGTGGTAAYRGKIQYYHGDDSMTFNTAASERMRIDSSGVMYIMGATPSTNNSLQMQYNSTAGTAEIYSKSTAGNTSFEFYTSNSGTTTKKLNINNIGTATFSPATGSGGIVQNAVTSLANSGYVNGNATLSFSYTNAVQASIRVAAVFNHYGYISSYGCSQVSTFANGPGGLDVQVIQSVTSSNGGQWSITQTSSSGFTISKTAGSYSGAGYYFIEIVGRDVQYA